MKITETKVNVINLCKNYLDNNVGSDFGCYKSEDSKLKNLNEV